MAHVCSRCKAPHVCGALCGSAVHRRWTHLCAKCGHHGNGEQMKPPSEAERGTMQQQLKDLIAALGKRMGL